MSNFEVNLERIHFLIKSWCDYFLDNFWVKLGFLIQRSGHTALWMVIGSKSLLQFVYDSLVTN